LETPSDYGLPHDDWRLHQFKTVQWLEKQSDIVSLEAPPGIGKTAIAVALAHGKSITALVKTKQLQDVNYGGIYGFDVLKGRANYRCAKPGREHLSAGECDHADTGMHRCPSSPACPYLVQKAVVRASPKASLNYSYWLAARWPRQDPPRVLVLDEADELPDIVTDHAGTTITEKQRLDWSLPDFPRVSGTVSLLAHENPMDKVFEWLEKSRIVLREHYKKLLASDNQVARARRRQCESLGMSVGNALDALRMSEEGWYVRSGPAALHGKPGFIAKPLTARFHFPRWFNLSETVLLMSATIGNPDPLAGELGVNFSAFRSVPSQWAPDMRQVLIPEEVPKLGKKAGESAYELQADLARDIIGDCPGDWAGIALVTSKFEAQNVANRLASRGFEDRVWLLPERDGRHFLGTGEQTALWQARKARVPNSIMVSWNHWRGYDGLDERLLLVFKTPFPRIGAPGSYENEQMRAGGAMYHWRTANMLAQGCGRTRRGREQDYGPENGLVAVLDGNWTRVRKHLSEDFLSAIVH